MTAVISDGMVYDDGMEWRRSRSASNFFSLSFSVEVGCFQSVPSQVKETLLHCKEQFSTARIELIDLLHPNSHPRRCSSEPTYVQNFVVLEIRRPPAGLSSVV